MTNRQPPPGVHENFAANLMEQAEPCPICDHLFKPDDLCATDIELGTCHAACLDGSPAVHLDTGEPLPEGSTMDTYRFAELATPARRLHQRELFEAAVVTRLKQSGFLEIEIRTECLARVDEGYQDEVINAGWHYWNEALWQNIPLVDSGFMSGPYGLDFATPDHIFDKGPEAAKEWQERHRRKPSPPPPQSHLVASGPRLVPVALGVVAAGDGPSPAVIADSGKAVVGLDVVSEHPSEQSRPNYADHDDSFCDVHDASPAELIPQNVRNFLGKVQGACMGVAMSGDDHPNPDGALMKLVEEAQELLFPAATTEGSK